MNTRPADVRWMKLALSLGRRGMGRTWPNPAVGCVIVKNGRVMGRGWTQDNGRPHAETVALAQAGSQAKGATAYVTLEPCAHQGKTPPCAEAFVRAGIARVVTAMTDPDPRVSGKGHGLLRKNGVKVETGCLNKDAGQDHMGFALRTEIGRPLVTLKLASSFDGRIATASGESKWITGGQSRRYVHHLRSTHDAVMVGAGTVRADDPGLSLHDAKTTDRPVRVFCDTRLSVDPACRLGRTARVTPVWVCHGPDAPETAIKSWQNTGAKLLPCALDQNARLQITDVLKTLAQQGLTRVFCEGGGQMAASLLQAGVVDRLIGYTAGLSLGASGMASVGELGIAKLAEHPRFDLCETRQIGGDVLHIWQRSVA